VLCPDPALVLAAFPMGNMLLLMSPVRPELPGYVCHSQSLPLCLLLSSCGLQIPSVEIDKGAPGRFFTFWDPDRKTFTVSLC